VTIAPMKLLPTRLVAMVSQSHEQTRMRSI
jgi:hypothetical protein